MHLRLASLALGLIACASSGSAKRNSVPARPVLAMDADRRALTGAVISAIIASFSTDTAAVCLTLSGPPPVYWYSPDASLLSAIRGGARRVVAPSDCPPTYDRMIVVVDSAGRVLDPVRPPSYIDPYDVVVREPVVVDADSAMVVTDVHQGAWNTHYKCTARRNPGGKWIAQCWRTGTSISALPPNVSLQLTSRWRASGTAPVGTAAEHWVSRPSGLAAELWR